MDVRAILSVNELDFKLPEDPDNTAGKVAFIKWQTEFKAISKNKLKWEENCQKIFNLYLHNFIPDMRSKLKPMNGWAGAKVTQDGISLIKMIRSISNQHDE